MQEDQCLAARGKRTLTEGDTGRLNRAKRVIFVMLTTDMGENARKPYVSDSPVGGECIDRGQLHSSKGGKGES